MVHLDAQLRPALEAWAVAVHPYEGVALLLGTRTPHRSLVHTWFSVRNMAAQPHHQFSIDPQGWLDADAEALRRGCDIIGVLHTHPQGDAVPSMSDTASGSALGQAMVYLIMATQSYPPVIRAWQWDGQGYTEDTLTWI